MARTQPRISGGVETSLGFGHLNRAATRMTFLDEEERRSRTRDMPLSEPHHMNRMIDATCARPPACDYKPKYIVNLKGVPNTKSPPHEYRSLDSIIDGSGISHADSYKSKVRDDDDDLALYASNTTPPPLKEGDLPETSSNSDCLGRAEATADTNGKQNLQARLVHDCSVDRIGAGDAGKVINERKKQAQRNSEKRPRFSGILTPYKAIAHVSEGLKVMELKIGKKTEHIDSYHTPLMRSIYLQYFPQHWRCVVKFGHVRGIADSTQKVVAREVACQEFLINLKEKYPDKEIPKYEIPSEMFLDPKVIHMVEKLGVQSRTDITYEIFTENSSSGGAEKDTCIYRCLYKVGSREFEGVSADKQYAQMKAADKVYEDFAGERYPLTVYEKGEECTPYVDYDFNETEVYQTCRKRRRL